MNELFTLLLTTYKVTNNLKSNSNEYRNRMQHLCGEIQ